MSQYSFYRNIDIQTNGVYLGKNPKALEKLKKLGVVLDL